MSYKSWLLVAVLLFIAGLILGLVTPDEATRFITEELEELEGLADYLTPLPETYVFILIFLKNVSVVLISLAFSPILCLVPLITLVLNGWIIGWVATSVLQQESLGYLMAGLVPHGIIEVPAFIMGEAVALSFGLAMMISLLKKKKTPPFIDNLRQNSKYLVASGILFLLAAVIETYATPLLLD